MNVRERPKLRVRHCDRDETNLVTCIFTLELRNDTK